MADIAAKTGQAATIEMPTKFVARAGLTVVGLILVACFGLLIAASHGHTVAQPLPLVVAH